MHSASMLPRHPAAVATIALALLCACGTSSEDNPGSDTPDASSSADANGADGSAEDVAEADGALAPDVHDEKDAGDNDADDYDADDHEGSVPDTGTPTGSWLSGASGNGFADGSFGAWRGRPNEIAGTWCDNSVDDQVNLWSTAPGFDLDGFAAPIDIAVGAIYKAQGETWHDAAQGAYDARWTQSLQTLKSRRQGLGTTYIRFAHEFNGDWWPHRWMVTGAEVADFVTAWQRYRALQQSIFPESRLAWCPNDGTSAANELDVRDAWPGDGHVDVVCVDSYNWWPYANSDAEFEAKIVMTGSKGEPRGLETWRLFAEEKGLPLAIGEWGSPATNDDGGGGGDAPGYMAAFHKWLEQHGGTGPGEVLYEVLFNQWEKFELWPNTKQPAAAEAYRDLW